jgi:hypothetical protein
MGGPTARAVRLDRGQIWCQDVTGAFTTSQGFAKAYPALRELTVLRDLGASGVVASLCARNLRDPQAQDHGYRAAFDPIIGRLKGGPTGWCLPSAVRPVRDPADAAHAVAPCSVTEARPIDSGSADCDPSRGRVALRPEEVAGVRADLAKKGVCDVGGAPPCSAFSLCRLAESDASCHTDATVLEASRPGWCLVDPQSNPTDNPAIVASCPAAERRALRFVDPEGATPEHGAPPKPRARRRVGPRWKLERSPAANSLPYCSPDRVIARDDPNALVGWIAGCRW